MSIAGPDACGPYGHDINFREVCAAWKRPPVKGLTRDQYEEWIEYVVMHDLRDLFREIAHDGFVAFLLIVSLIIGMS